MWPWEHLAFGYLFYSLAARAYYRRPPVGAAAIAVAAGTQVPDLLDKSLAWLFDVFAVGFAVGHSALVVPPALAVAYVLATRRRPAAGRLVPAYGVGHLSHLLGDLLYPVLQGTGLPLRRVLWPVASPEAGEVREPVLRRVAGYFLRYLFQVLSLDPSPLFLVQVGLVASVFVLWLVDGAPGPLALWRGTAALVSRSESPD
jgi:hypothetical protein